MWRRVALAAVAIPQAEIGVWGEVSPRGFFDRYPGVFGQRWVSMLGAYDEHLVRDFAAAELGFAVLLLAAALWFERRLAIVAGAAFLVFTVPHFTYHLTTTGSMSTAANLLSLGGFVVEIAVVAAVVLASARVAPPRPRHLKESSNDTLDPRAGARA